MDDNYVFPKPSMTNLPKDLGRAIIREIMSAPIPDRKARWEEADRLEREIIKQLEKDEANG